MAFSHMNEVFNIKPCCHFRGFEKFKILSFFFNQIKINVFFSLLVDLQVIQKAIERLFMDSSSSTTDEEIYYASNFAEDSDNDKETSNDSEVEKFSQMFDREVDRDFIKETETLEKWWGKSDDSIFTEHIGIFFMFF